MTRHDNDNKPRMAIRGEWVGDTFCPDSPQAKLDMGAIEAKRNLEQSAMHRERSRLAIRMKIGKDWDGTAVNDNIAWPLATALIREGNTELMKAAMAYRKIHTEAHSGAVLGGTVVAIGDGFALDRHTQIRADGNIAYKHIRQRTAAEVDIPARQYVPPFEDEETAELRNSVRIPKPWRGDEPVNNKMDAQTRLTSLRSILGVLTEPLEMSVIDGKTYEEVGKTLGNAHKLPAIAAGRAAITLGLIAVRDALGNVTRAALAA